MKTAITIQMEVSGSDEAKKVTKAFQTMDKHFGAKGIIKMEQLFLNDAFIRNLVKMKLA